MTSLLDESNMVAQIPTRKTIARPLTPRKVVYVIGRNTFSSAAFNRHVRRLLALLVIVVVMVGIWIQAGDQLIQATLLAIESIRGAPAPQATADPVVSAPPPIMASPNVAPTSIAPDTEIAVAIGPSRVRIDDVNLRQLPGSEQAQITVLFRGTSVEVLGQAERIGDAIWIYVRAQGKEGWVNQKYIIPADEYASESRPRARVIGVRPARLLVRADPSPNADVQGKLSEGAEVILINTRETDGIAWWLIEIDNLQGWVNASYIEPLP